MAAIDENDLDASMATMGDLVTTMKSVTPPAEISADWALLAGAFSTMHEKLVNTLENPLSEEAQQEAETAADFVSDEDAIAANANIKAWVDANC